MPSSLTPAPRNLLCGLCLTQIPRGVPHYANATFSPSKRVHMQRICHGCYSDHIYAQVMLASDLPEGGISCEDVAAWARAGEETHSKQRVLARMTTKR